MAHADNIANSFTKPEFTDYTMAGVTEMSLAMRDEYEASIAYIRTGRSLRRFCRKTDVRHTAQAAKRCGYPKRRERDPERQSKRGVPHSKFLNQFKIVDRITFERTKENFLGEFVHKAKIYVLHATRGWKFYA